MQRPKGEQARALETGLELPLENPPDNSKKPLKPEEPKRGVSTEPLSKDMLPDARDQFDGYAGTTVDI
jgi:hypothetical protein